MNKSVFSSTIIFLLLMLGSCGPEELVCERASYDTVTESRDLEGFNSIAFNTVGDLYIYEGSEFEIEIEGPDNVVTKTTTFLEGNRLVVGSETCFNGSYSLKVTVTAPSWEKINFSGTGDLYIKDGIEGDVIRVELFGIGKADMNVNAKTLYTTMSGQGNIAIAGKVEQHEFVSSGEFQLNSYDLLTVRTLIKLSGLGDCHVSASDKLNVSITGNGNVFYKGNPVISTDITGVGNVIDDN